MLQFSHFHFSYLFLPEGEQHPSGVAPFSFGDDMTEQDFLYNNTGRREIFTSAVRVDETNIIGILQDATVKFGVNAEKCDYLLNYDAGIQPLQRKKPKAVRPDIDFTCIDNVANEIVEFKLGYQWQPITLVQRGVVDSGNEDEGQAIALLNELYATEHIDDKTQALARFVEVCGIGYTFVDIKTDWEDGESYFQVECLDPRTTFVVRSNRYPDHRIILGVTFSMDDDNAFHFTCFTPESRYEIVNATAIVDGKKVETWNHEERSGERNPLGLIPIIEWKRSHDRMGCFERQLSECDSLNLLWSDVLNDTDQNTQAIWHTNDVEFPSISIQDGDDEDGDPTVITQHPSGGDWVETFTSPDGKTPFIKPLTLDYDYNGLLSNILAKRALILQKCNVPARNDNSGGSTGVAMSDATGWTAAESAAIKQQALMESSKMQELKVVLRAIQKSPFVESDNPLLKLRYVDIKPNIKLQKTHEMITKANTYATYVSHGINGLHALRVTGAFDDINQVWEDSKEMIEKYQTNLFEKQQSSQGEENLGFSESLDNQIQNSPVIDGNSKEDPSPKGGVAK